MAPGTSQKTNANAMAMLHKDTIFTNVGLTADKQPWWEGKDSNRPVTDWQGRPYDLSRGPAAHPNSRFTVSSSRCPSYSEKSEASEGVPISAIIFGGRRERLVSTALLAVSLLAVTVAVGSQLDGRLDQISSGRLSLWETVIDRNMGDMTTGEALFGVGSLEQTYLASHDSVVAEARFTRAHADNAYLDLFVSLGLVGVLLFLCPLVLVARDLLVGIARYRQHEQLARDLRAAVATLAGLLVQGIVVSNLPSLGNLMNLLCMTLVMAVWGHVHRIDAIRIRATVPDPRRRRAV